MWHHFRVFHIWPHVMDYSQNKALSTVHSVSPRGRRPSYLPFSFCMCLFLTYPDSPIQSWYCSAFLPCEHYLFTACCLWSILFTDDSVYTNAASWRKLLALPNRMITCWCTCLEFYFNSSSIFKLCHYAHANAQKNWSSKYCSSKTVGWKMFNLSHVRIKIKQGFVIM